MYSVQFRPRFCICDAEYFILTQNEMIVESYRLDFHRSLLIEPKSHTDAKTKKNHKLPHI